MRNQGFNEELKIMIDGVKKIEKDQILVIFLDKIFPAYFSGVGKASKFIDDHMCDGVKYCKIQMIPETTNPKIASYPFSYEFVM